VTEGVFEEVMSYLDMPSHLVVESGHHNASFARGLETPSSCQCARERKRLLSQQQSHEPDACMIM
jgi:hypothetical protein